MLENAGSLSITLNKTEGETRQSGLTGSISAGGGRARGGAAAVLCVRDGWDAGAATGAASVACAANASLGFATAAVDAALPAGAGIGSGFGFAAGSSGSAGLGSASLGSAALGDAAGAPIANLMGAGRNAEGPGACLASCCAPAGGGSSERRTASARPYR